MAAVARPYSSGGAGPSVRGGGLAFDEVTFDDVPRYGPDGTPAKPAPSRSGVQSIPEHRDVELDDELSELGTNRGFSGRNQRDPLGDRGLHGVELENDGDGGWYRAESGRLEQERKAVIHLAAIQVAVDRHWEEHLIKEKRWCNDPEEVDDGTFPEVTPFLPREESVHVPGERPPAAQYADGEADPEAYPEAQQANPMVTHKKEDLDQTAAFGGANLDQTAAFGTPGKLHVVHKKNSGCCGGGGDGNPRPDQHPLDRQGFVVQPNAADPDTLSEEGAVPKEQIHCRPWVRLMEYAQSAGPGCGGAMSVMVDKSQNITHCGRVYQGELDNAYLVEALNAISLRPKLVQQLFHRWDKDRSIFILSLFKNGTWLRVEVDDFFPASKGQDPYCCRSEYFPNVIWPSLVEKAYAKSCTVRGTSDYRDSGGWEALGGGGQVDEALSDLTGGVSGSWRTSDVSSDRLFIYLHALQREALFVCRVHLGHCTRNGVCLNPMAHHSVNRATVVDGGCYVQVFAAHPEGVHSGGLDNLSVPISLYQMFPEKSGDGFIWMSAFDFHTYFDVVYECRLVNSIDVGIEGMPESRLDPRYGPGLLPSLPWREEPLFYEWVFANGGAVTEHCPPEFTVVLPDADCEVIACVEQTDPRIMQVGARRREHESLLLKVYQHIRADCYSIDMVCKSNWMPARGSMVAFKSAHGGKFKIICEMPESARCDRLIFRCYSSHPGCQVNGGTSYASHSLASPEEPPLGLKWTFVGVVQNERLRRVDEPTVPPQDLDELKKYHADHGQCAVM
mmetsp:Transcript_100851/g.217743  ORF Transcript_100851/g.217743 Transcript_100851/m.217743 type:complete len:787 (-) Transcript_100851:23-2383(-)